MPSASLIIVILLDLIILKKIGDKVECYKQNFITD